MGLMVGIGGHGRSAGFRGMTAMKSRRKKFLMALRELLEENELDGVDFNWEFPQKPDEWQKWGLLMQEAKVLLGEKRNLVTFTMHNVEELFDLIVGYDLLRGADYVHCMVYDAKGKHSTFEHAQ